MPSWPFQRKKNAVPTYSLLEQILSRPLPEELAAQEGSDDFAGWRDRIESELLDQETDENAFGFATFLKFHQGMLQIRVPESSDLCLLVFSTPLRAADYARVQMAGEKFEYVASSASQTVSVLRDCREQANTTHIALDRCPRCSTFVTVGTSDLDSPRKLIRLWKISKATEFARCNLYWNYARSSAREDKLMLARDIALELVGHVTADDPRVHLLLGKLAIRLQDKTLLREAQSFLAFLRQDPYVEELRIAERGNEWQF